MRKKILTIAAVAGFSLTSNAQEVVFGKKDVIVEGNLSFNSIDNKNTALKISNFEFRPKVGYFFADKLAAGISVNLGYTINDQYAKDQYGNERRVKHNNLGVGLFGRYYFLELGARFKTYTELNVDFNGTKSKTTFDRISTSTPKTNNLDVTAGIGANYFLTNKIALNFSFSNIVGFRTSKLDKDGAKANNEFRLNINEFDNFFNTAKFGLMFKF